MSFLSTFFFSLPLFFSVAVAANKPCEQALRSVQVRIEVSRELVWNPPQLPVPKGEISPFELNEASASFIPEPRAYLESQGIAFLQNLRPTNIDIVRSGQRIGSQGILGGHIVLVQDPISFNPENKRSRTSYAASILLQIQAAKAGFAVPVLGYVIKNGKIALVRTILPGELVNSVSPSWGKLGIDPSRIQLTADPSEVRFASFGTRTILRMEQMIANFEALQANHIALHIHPGQSREQIDQALGRFLHKTPIVMIDDRFYIEDLRLTELDIDNSEENSESRFVLSLPNILRANLQRKLFEVTSSFYRSSLWNESPQAVYELDLLNQFLLSVNSRALPVYPNQIEDLKTIFSSVYNDAKTPFPRPTEFGITNKKLKYHFKKHGPEMNILTIDEYLTRATGFITAPESSSRSYVVRPSGDIALYDQKTNEFAVFTAIGVLRTYFHPVPTMHKRGLNNSIVPLIEIYEDWLQESGTALNLEPWGKNTNPDKKVHSDIMKTTRW